MKTKKNVSNIVLMGILAALYIGDLVAIAIVS